VRIALTEGCVGRSVLPYISGQGTLSSG